MVGNHEGFKFCNLRHLAALTNLFWQKNNYSRLGPFDACPNISKFGPAKSSARDVIMTRRIADPGGVDGDPDRSSSDPTLENQTEPDPTL